MVTLDLPVGPRAEAGARGSARGGAARGRGRIQPPNGSACRYCHREGRSTRPEAIPLLYLPGPAARLPERADAARHPGVLPGGVPAGDPGKLLQVLPTNPFRRETPNRPEPGSTASARPASGLLVNRKACPGRAGFLRAARRLSLAQQPGSRHIAEEWTPSLRRAEGPPIHPVLGLPTSLPVPPPAALRGEALERDCGLRGDIRVPIPRHS